MALSDAEVEKQINHMKRFIEQEATEKAEEIKIKAEEEFNIEKGRILQVEKRKVSTYYERKVKQLELQRKIQHSNLLNQARLAVLKARDDHVRGIVEETRERLGEVTKDPAKYKKLLQDLVVQGMYQLLEDEVVVLCRKADLTVVKSICLTAMQAYKKGTTRDCKLRVDESTFLSAEISGGVQLQTVTGSIRCVNTFEARLELLSSQMMPEIRTMLFGANPSRHFMD